MDQVLITGRGDQKNFPGFGLKMKELKILIFFAPVKVFLICSQCIILRLCTPRQDKLAGKEVFSSVLVTPSIPSGSVMVTFSRNVISTNPMMHFGSGYCNRSQKANMPMAT